MPRGIFHLLCLDAVLLAGASAAVFADGTAPAPQPAPGYKYTDTKVGGRVIRVQQADPFHNVKSSPDPSGKYQPASINFNATSSMAGKTFDSTHGTSWGKGVDLDQRGVFPTSSYPFPPAAYAGTKTAFHTTAFQGIASANLAKKYDGLNTDAAQNQIAQGLVSAPEQNRTSAFADQAYHTGPAAFAKKAFAGSELDALHRGLTPMKDGKLLVSDLPNRPLSIDEVRDLINHGFKPNTDEKAALPSKPLNDPDYQPEPLREEPASDDPPSPRARPVEDNDKDDAVPSPGSMAQPAPENAEPLPKP